MKPKRTSADWTPEEHEKYWLDLTKFMRERRKRRDAQTEEFSEEFLESKEYKKLLSELNLP